MPTPLPSFVELMASLGLEQKTVAPEPVLHGERPLPSPVKAKSTPSLREVASKQRATRFSPYSSAVSSSNRRGSVSSNSSYSSSSSRGTSPVQETSGSTHRSTSPRSRRTRNTLCLNVYGSSSDLPANMPISTYVRRKTPATTPTSPTFPRDTRGDCCDIPKTLMIPVLPSLLPNSASSDSFPITPNDSETTFPDQISPALHKSLKPSPELLPEHGGGRVGPRHLPYFTGVRISTSSRYSLNEQYMRKDALVDMA